MALARKGFLFEGLRVTSPSGTVLATLTQWETRGLTALAVESLFRLAKRESTMGPTPTPPQSALNSRDDAIMWDVIASAVCLVGAGGRKTHLDGSHPTPEQQQLIMARDDALRRISQLSCDFSPYWKEKISALCRVFADSYLIVADVPTQDSSNNLILQYSSSFSPERMHLSKYERIRSRFGLSPMTIDVPMSRALHADSYHFEVTAPTGCYVFSHHLERLGSREPVKQPELRIGTVPQYARLYHEDGRSHAHLYIRAQGARTDIVKDQLQTLLRPDLKSIVRFRETPPGVLGNAALLALVSTIVIAFFGISRVGIDSPTASTSLPALILALPAFLGSALGRSLDHDRLGRAPLMAFFGLNAVIILSLASTLLYIFEAARTLKAIELAQAAGTALPLRVAMPTETDFTLLGGSIMVHTDAFWLTIFFATAVVATYLLRERRNALRYYLTITGKRAFETDGWR
jgi:hypothetical protein